MTISTNKNRISHTGDGVQTIFGYDFPVYDVSHMRVFLDGVLTPSGWSIDGIGEPLGGNITFTTAPADGVTVTFLRDVPPTQLTDYVAYDPFPAETHERALDLAAMRDQQYDEQLDRTLKYSIDTQVDPGDTVIPEPVPLRSLSTDDQNNLIWADTGVGGGAPVVNPLVADLLTGGFSIIGQDGVGGNTTFSLTGATGVIDATEFTRQGQNLDARYAALVHGHAVFTTSTDGFVPAPGAGSATRVLRPDGTWGDESQGGHQIQDETTTYTKRFNLKFVGFDLSDDIPGDATVVQNPQDPAIAPIDLAGLSEYEWDLDASTLYEVHLDNFLSASAGEVVLELSENGSTFIANDWTWGGTFANSGGSVTGVGAPQGSFDRFPVAQYNAGIAFTPSRFELDRHGVSGIFTTCFMRGNVGSTGGLSNAIDYHGHTGSANAAVKARIRLTAGTLTTGEIRIYRRQKDTSSLGAGVDSFNLRTGPVVSEAGDYDAFYYTKAQSDANYEVAGAVATHELAFDHGDIPSAAQKLALDASSTPGAGNPYLTQSAGDAAYVGTPTGAANRAVSLVGNGQIQDAGFDAFDQDTVTYRDAKTDATDTVALTLTGAPRITVSNPGSVTITPPNTGQGDILVIIDGPSAITLPPGGGTDQWDAVFGTQPTLPAVGLAVRDGSKKYFVWGAGTP